MERDVEVWWIRHGQSEWNASFRWQGHTDVALSAEGQRQASLLGRRLRNVEFQAVYSSDLERARATARLALPEARLIEDPRLREVHFGVFEGCTRDELDDEKLALLEDWLRDPFGRRLPEGESMNDLAARLGAWLDELPATGRVAVFTHGGVIRCSLWTITGPPLGNRWTVQLANAGITCIRYARRTSIERVNDCAHLEA